MTDSAHLQAPIRIATKRRRLSRRIIADNITGYLFLGPWLIGFFVFVVGPMLASAYLSFTNYSGFGPARWVGTQNYKRMFSDQLFYESLYNTAYYAFIGVPLQLFVALILATMLNMRVPYVNFFRTAYYIPTVTPSVANVFLWVWILNYDFGLINALLRPLGIAPVNWLWNTRVVKPALILMSLWSVGQQMVIFLAALQSVPDELLDAASIDGATGLRRFLSVTIPLISPVIFLNMIIGIIGSWQIFTVAFIATGGGPVNSSLFYVLYIYRSGFEYFRMSYASSLAWGLFFVIMILTALQFMFSSRWVYYESEASVS